MLKISGMGMPAADELSRNQGCSAAEGRKRERRSKTLGKTSQFGDALADGSVTAEHVDALANATARLDESLAEQFFGHESDLLAKATASTPEQFSRHCRNLVTKLERDERLARNERQRRDTCLTRKIDRDGMYTIHGRFHPELGERIWKAIHDRGAGGQEPTESGAMPHFDEQDTADRSEGAGQ